VLLALPYMWLRRPSIRKRDFVRKCAEIAAVDAVTLAGHISGAVEGRILVI
jgi:hypothetical protein